MFKLYKSDALSSNGYVLLLVSIPLDYVSKLRLECLQRVWTPTPRVGARARNSPPRRNSPPSTAPLLSATLPLDGTDRFLIVQRNRPIVTATSRRLDRAMICSSRSSSQIYTAHNISTLFHFVYGLYVFSGSVSNKTVSLLNPKRLLIRDQNANK